MLIKVVIIVGMVFLGHFYWQSQSAEKQAQLIGSLPFTSKPKEPEKPVSSKEPVKTKPTVYQTQGRHGEVEFSDGRSITATSQVRVVNDAKGVTLYTNAPDKK